MILPFPVRTCEPPECPYQTIERLKGEVAYLENQVDTLRQERRIMASMKKRWWERWL